MKNIWQELTKPIICLAPMEDVTDTVLRRLLAEIGKPPLMFTEFVNVRHVYSHSNDNRRLEYTQIEKPLILQIWGMEPELYYQMGQLAVALGYDGVDINMGCPQKTIIKKGACSALIDNRSLAHELITALQEGVNGKIPVSVKTRIGFKQKVTEDWSEFLLSHDLAALTMHGRTSAQMSKVPADWDEISKVVNVRDQMKKDTFVIGNGDVVSYEDGLDKVSRYNVDGVMVARGIFQNPWLFNSEKSRSDRSIQEKLETLIKHLELWESTWEGSASYHKLKRFFKIYVSEFDGASELRTVLMETDCIDDARKVVNDYLSEEVGE